MYLVLLTSGSCSEALDLRLGSLMMRGRPLGLKLKASLLPSLFRVPELKISKMHMPLNRSFEC